MATEVSGVAVVGALGRMGERVREALAGEPSLQLAAALEAPGHPALGSEVGAGVRLGDDPKAAFAGSRVAIDFSVPEATLANLRVAAESGVAYVTGTTGFDPKQWGEVRELSLRTAVLHAPNFSLSVNLLVRLTAEAARVLGPDFDAEIVEVHHAAKRDAPSGTALRLAEAVASARGQELAEHLVLERAGETGARPPGAIGVQALRGGDNPGEHSVYFVGQGERIELIHRSQTRDHFAKGAVRAAAWLVGKGPGLYAIDEVLGF